MKSYCTSQIYHIQLFAYMDVLVKNKIASQLDKQETLPTQFWFINHNSQP